MATKTKSSLNVGSELNAVLDHLAGIPARKEKAAMKIQSGPSHVDGPHPLGMWFGGCYYIRSKRGTVQGKTGRWRRVACIA